MRIIGCDLHSRQQTLAMLDTATGEIEKTTLKHEENIAREFYSNLPRPVRVGQDPHGRRFITRAGPAFITRPRLLPRPS